MSYPCTTWLVTPELVCEPDRLVSTPEGALTSIVSLLFRIAEQLKRVNADQGVILLDKFAAAQLGLDVDPVDGRHRALDYAEAQGWCHTQLGPFTTFYAKDRKSRPEIHVGQLARLEAAGPDFWPWGFSIGAQGGLCYRWPGDIVACLNHWQRLSGVAWQAGPAVMGLELIHKTLPAYRWKDANGKSHQARPEKYCDATPPEASEPPWSPAMWRGSEIPEGARWLHQIDRVRAGLTACGAALCAGPRLTRGWRRFDPTRAGWWLISLPPWCDPRMPHPLGPGKVWSRVWRTTDTLALGADLARQGLLDMPEIIDSLTGLGRQLLQPFQQLVESVYQAPPEPGYDADDMRPVIQDVAKDLGRRAPSMLASGAKRPEAAGPRPTVFRPDWAGAQSASKRNNGWRRAWKIGNATGMWPAYVDDDGWWYASSEADPYRAFAAATQAVETNRLGQDVPILNLREDIPGAYVPKKTRELVTT